MYMTHQKKTAVTNKSAFWKGILASSWTSFFHLGRLNLHHATTANTTQPTPYTGFRVPQSAQSYDMLVASDVVTGISTVLP